MIVAIFENMAFRQSIRVEQDGRWIGTSLSMPAPGTAEKGSILVVPEEVLDDARVKEAHRAGLRVYAYLDALRPSPLDAAKIPIEWFEQSRFYADAPSKQTGLLSLNNEDALRYQKARADRISRSVGWLDGVLISSGLRTNASFVYSQSTRESAISSTGLDPLDFYDPLEIGNDESHEKAFDMPPGLAKFLFTKEADDMLKVLRPLLATFVANKRSVAVICDPDVLGASLNKRVGLCGVWPILATSPGVTELWLKSTGRDTDTSLKSLSDGLQALNVEGYTVTIFGDSASLKSYVETKPKTSSLGFIKIVRRMP